MLKLSITAYVSRGCEACDAFMRDLTTVYAPGMDIDAVVNIDDEPNSGLRAAITRVPYFTAHKDDCLVGTKLGYRDLNDLAEWRREMLKVEVAE